jgi:hypothetical protein
VNSGKADERLKEMGIDPGSLALSTKANIISEQGMNNDLMKMIVDSIKNMYGGDSTYGQLAIKDTLGVGATQAAYIWQGKDYNDVKIGKEGIPERKRNGEDDYATAVEHFKNAMTEVGMNLMPEQMKNLKESIDLACKELEKINGSGIKSAMEGGGIGGAGGAPFGDLTEAVKENTEVIKTGGFKRVGYRMVAVKALD